jgi:hypothetical protein
MTVIDLNRHFIPIKPDQEPLDFGREMGRVYGGWLDWDQLLTKRRVVLLAEAKSGKTEEFRIRAAALRGRGEAGFFLRVEDLADGGLVDDLTPEEKIRFAEWQGGNALGWFFLDSVDEARLNAKSFERALRRFRRDLGAALDRASVLISCRVSDWKGAQDRDLITEWLPVESHRPSVEEAVSINELLLHPVLSERTQSKVEKESTDAEEVLTVVRLADLDREQRALLARSAKVADSETFIRAIERQGLGTFAQRPGDLLELAEYWKAHGRFGSFAEMTSFSIRQKLAEREMDRADADVLADDRAREGAERVAAALTLGKEFTLRAPGQDPDPTLAAGALDPADILPDWKPSERAVLLRRGVFAPATYGRIRFHHRSTQEYLTAQWLKRALDHGCPRAEVMYLLFAEPYGVETAVPSMRVSAAWLALADTKTRDELLDRAPLELIRHGDPRSLPLQTRARLLIAYADQQKEGKVPEGMIEDRSFWMFSDPALAPAIREAWARNTDPSFRTDLLSVVREGEIFECVDLARLQAFDTGAEAHFRYAALQTMAAINDQEGLAGVADQLLADPPAFSGRYAARFAQHLFPTHLSRSDLIRLIDELHPTSRSAEGFPNYLKDLWERCPWAEREAFLEELADLCLMPPFRDEYHRVSGKHGRLAWALAPLAADMALTLGAGPIPPALIKACAAVERSEDYPYRDDRQALWDALRDRFGVQCELFWFDVQEAGRNHERDITHWWQLGMFGARLWHFSALDPEWLIERVRNERALQDRQIVFSALISRLGAEMLQTRADELRELVAGISELESDLALALSPPPAEPDEEREAERERIHAQQREMQNAQLSQFWLLFAGRLRADSSHLRDRVKLAEWENAADLLLLTTWLSYKTGESREAAACHWPLLRDVFGDEVAQAYRAGMKLMWRLTVPRLENRERTIDQREQLSFYGVGLEAEEGEGWAERLAPDEAELAVLHGLYVGGRSPKWIEGLARVHPERVKPLIANEVVVEWAATSGFSREVISAIAEGGDEYFLQTADLVVDRLRERPGRVHTFDTGLRVLARLPQTAVLRAELIAHATNELRRNAKDEEWALRQIALVFTCDLTEGIETLERWLRASMSDDKRKARGVRAFATLFSRHHPLVPIDFEDQAAGVLMRLVLLAYRAVRIEEDVQHEGVFSPGTRDEAQWARGRILEALLATPGRETYEALCALAEDPSIGSRKRFRELAHRRAEQDAELAAWSPADVVEFERKHAAPAKTGGDLLRITVGILNDIQTGFQQSDASSRHLLEAALDEAAVQHWLAEQFGLRSKNRFHVYREVEVANRKEPDIVLASTAAAVQVAVEVKHGGKGWTVRELESALCQQLVGDYLRPATRRHGVLVITRHTTRKWEEPGTNRKLDFEQLLDRLRRLAATIRHNETGPIEALVIGLDASSRENTSQGSTRKPRAHRKSRQSTGSD